MSIRANQDLTNQPMTLEGNTQSLHSDVPKLVPYNMIPNQHPKEEMFIRNIIKQQFQTALSRHVELKSGIEGVADTGKLTAINLNGMNPVDFINKYTGKTEEKINALLLYPVIRSINLTDSSIKLIFNWGDADLLTPEEQISQIRTINAPAISDLLIDFQSAPPTLGQNYIKNPSPLMPHWKVEQIPRFKYLSVDYQMIINLFKQKLKPQNLMFYPFDLFRSDIITTAKGMNPPILRAFAESFYIPLDKFGHCDHHYVEYVYKVFWSAFHQTSLHYAGIAQKNNMPQFLSDLEKLNIKILNEASITLVKQFTLIVKHYSEKYKSKSKAMEALDSQIDIFLDLIEEMGSVDQKKETHSLEEMFKTAKENIQNHAQTQWTLTEITDVETNPKTLERLMKDKELCFHKAIIEGRSVYHFAPFNKEMLLKILDTALKNNNAGQLDILKKLLAGIQSDDFELFSEAQTMIQIFEKKSLAEKERLELLEQTTNKPKALMVSIPTGGVVSMIGFVMLSISGLTLIPAFFLSTLPATLIGYLVYVWANRYFSPGETLKRKEFESQERKLALKARALSNAAGSEKGETGKGSVSKGVTVKSSESSIISNVALKYLYPKKFESSSDKIFSKKKILEDAKKQVNNLKKELPSSLQGKDNDKIATTLADAYIKKHCAIIAIPNEFEELFTKNYPKEVILPRSDLVSNSVFRNELADHYRKKLESTANKKTQNYYKFIINTIERDYYKFRS